MDGGTGDIVWDLCMQTSHQSQCFRLVQFFNHPLLRSRVFPSQNFAKSAEEIGPRTNRQGPCLVLFSHLESSPSEFLEWFRSSLIRRHIPRLYWFPRLASDPCIVPSSSPESQQQDESAIASCSGHAAPLPPDIVRGSGFWAGGPLKSREALLADICRGGTLPGVKLRLSCTPRDIEKLLVEQLPEEFDLDLHGFSAVLQVVEVAGWLRWCVMPAAWMYLLPSDEPKLLRGCVAHAVNKLDEALMVSGTKEQGGPRVAIDIGAAPGAWSSYMADMAELVIAVDPAQLHPDVMRPNLHHVKKKAEESVGDVEELLAGRQADMLTCDMNYQPTEAAAVVMPLLPYLKPGGTLVMTLKFVGTGRDRSGIHAKLADIFKADLEEGLVVWLLANTVCEQTWIAQKRRLRAE